MITGIGLALSACATAAIPVESTELRILLTNDDGVDAPGIKTVRAALLEGIKVGKVQRSPAAGR
jgi:hypothetical protein